MFIRSATVLRLKYARRYGLVNFFHEHRPPADALTEINHRQVPAGRQHADSTIVLGQIETPLRSAS